MTKEMMNKIENLVATFNANVIGSNDIAMMIEANTGRLDHIVKAKMALATLIRDFESLGYVVNVKTNNGFINYISYSK